MPSVTWIFCGNCEGLAASYQLKYMTKKPTETLEMSRTKSWSVRHNTISIQQCLLMFFTKLTKIFHIPTPRYI